MRVGARAVRVGMTVGVGAGCGHGIGNLVSKNSGTWRCVTCHRRRRNQSHNKVSRVND